jgi:hypothetical protein
MKKKYIIANKENGQSGIEEIDEASAQDIASAGGLVFDIESGKALNFLKAPYIGPGEAVISGITEGAGGVLGLGYDPGRSSAIKDQQPIQSMIF